MGAIASKWLNSTCGPFDLCEEGAVKEFCFEEDPECTCEYVSCGHITGSAPDVTTGPHCRICTRACKSIFDNFWCTDEIRIEHDSIGTEHTYTKAVLDEFDEELWPCSHISSFDYSCLATQDNDVKYACSYTLKDSEAAVVVDSAQYVQSSTSVECANMDVDCEGTWSTCTSACETADQRTFTEAVAQSGNGASCPEPIDCQPGEGECPPTDTDVTADTDTVTP